MNPGAKRRQRGAALLMLLMILGVIGSFFAVRTLGIVGSQVRQITDTTAVLTEVKDALIGYAASRPTVPYLPCPDKTAAAGVGTPNDGLEDRTGGSCVVAEGNLPWITLGLKGTDSWGNRFRYRVTPAFSNSITGMQLTSVGTMTVNDLSVNALATTVPVVILSHGKNAWGARTSAGVAIAAPPVANVNERENTDADNIFVSGPSVEPGAVGGEFDDLGAWLTTAILLARMQQAGKL